MAPKRIVLDTIGILPITKPKTIRVTDDCTANLLRDIPFMSTDVLRMMKDNCSKAVKLAVKAELLLRSTEMGWQHTPRHECADYTLDEEPEVFVDSNVDDDFVPFGEDGQLPKRLRPAQPAWMKYVDTHIPLEFLLRLEDDYFVFERFPW